VCTRSAACSIKVCELRGYLSRSKAEFWRPGLNRRTQHFHDRQELIAPELFCAILLFRVDLSCRRGTMSSSSIA
jgi:hypothetical protein